jgi:hypothetical protein
VAFTTITVTVIASMLSMIVAIIAGHYSGRSPDAGLIDSLLVSLIVIPIVAVLLSTPLYNLVTLYDWPNNAYVLPPQFAIWGAAALGGFLGFRSGMIWNRGETSCVYCLLSLVSVLAGLSLVLVLVL